MVHYRLEATAWLNGICSIEPTCGWGSCTSFNIKVICEWCGFRSGFLMLSSENRIPLARGRFAHLISKCKSCPRTGFVTIHHLPKGILDILQLEFEGLQPLDGNLHFSDPFVAVDFHGRPSSEFEFIVDCPAAKIVPQFNSASLYSRNITGIDVKYARMQPAV